MRQMRAIAGSVVATVTLLAGCTVTVDGTASPRAAGSGDVVDPLAPVPDHDPAKLAWWGCDDLIDPSGLSTDGRTITYDCASFQVPVDYAEADGDKLELMLIKAHLEGAPKDLTPMLINPGGPGGSGLEAAIGLAYELPQTLLQHKDIIGFDPRGVGESTPVSCLEDDQRDELAATDPTPDDEKEQQQLVDDADTLVDGCIDAYPDLVHINTVATARDMEQLRKAFGVDKLDYLGYSYGTELGTVYATLFPDKVGRFVLDGAVDPTIDDDASSEQQLDGFEKAFGRFVANCAADPACPLAPDPQAKALELIAQSDKAGIPNPNDDRLATEGIVRTAFAAALYDEASWPDLAAAISSGLGGDSTGLFELADMYNGRYEMDGDIIWSNMLDANVAISCNDSEPGDSGGIEEAKKQAEEWAAKYPVFGAYFGWGVSPCDQWPGPRHPLPEVSTADADPILVVGTTNDPATPYSGAVNLQKALGPKTGLLTYDGDGHTAFPATDCVNNAVVGYLVDGTIPPAGTVCPAG